MELDFIIGKNIILNNKIILILTLFFFGCAVRESSFKQNNDQRIKILDNNVFCLPNQLHSKNN